jgi:yeast amino acid transporter
MLSNPISLQPYLAYWGVIWTIIFILITGFQVFFHFKVSDFFTACEFSLTVMRDSADLRTLDVNIPLFTVLYFGYKFTMRTKIWKPEEMDFVTVCLLYLFQSLKPD